MSDMNIPGVTGTYDNYVEALMKVERVPRDNAQKDLDTYKDKRTAWQNVNRLASTLRKSSNALYSFNNPFAEKIVGSSDENAVTATATRSAENASFKIKVDKIASSDSFLSQPIDKKMEVPAGTYTFVVGDKTISFNWKGGNYRAFMDTINKRGKDILSVSEIKTASNSSSLLFKSEVLGEANRLQFEDDALTFALENGILKKNDGSVVGFDRQSVSVQPLSSDKIVFSKTVRGSDGNILEITVNKGAGSVSSGTPPPGQQDAGTVGTPATADTKTFEKLGTLSYQGITVTNEASSAGRLPETPPLPAPNTPAPSQNPAGGSIPQGTNLNIFSLESARGVLIPLPPISNIDEEQKITVDLAEYGDVKALVLNNPNPNIQIDVSNIRIYDPKSTGEYTAANPVSVASDAQLEFEGIKISRPTNNIDDLIPGVTLNLHDKTEGTAKVDVEPDKELIKNSIIEFVANYNQVLTEINILTQINPEIIDELTYLTDEEREAAEKRLGLLSGDSALNGLKNQLRLNATAPYRATDETAIMLLSSLGISTNSSVGGGELEAGRLRGYLEIDEKKLDEAISNNLTDVKAFFGFDQNGDKLVDSGLAYTMYTQLSPYTDRGGIFATRITSLNTKITSSTEKIAEYDKKLAAKEKELKRKYKVMEGTLKDMQGQSDKIKSFSKQKGE
ncbi:MAG: flagellar filament capping protein FliD [Treponemataceae bacterium]